MPAKSPSGSARRWTTLASLREQSRKAWDNGSLLRELATPAGTFPRRRPLKGPNARELRERYAEARQWAADLHQGAGAFTLCLASVGQRTIGANEIPIAAVFETVDDEIAFVGKSREAKAFGTLASRLADIDQALHQWAAKRPLQLLKLGEDAITAAGVAVWFRDHPSPGIYLRQLSLPGVHTKFVESHRRTIDEMVAALDPEHPRTGAGFEHRHGFLSAPEQVRFRLLDPDIVLLGAARDITVTAAGFEELSPAVDTVIVTENLVNFLALPPRPGTLAVFGRGYGFTALQEAEWLRHCRIRYWGDLDSHGFAILDQLRASLPRVESVMMDTGTLLEHRDLWGRESKPANASLTRLTPEESDVYQALRDDVYGPAVRLEQEHINWDWALERL